mmetsp:Transcript_5405/g.10444  ORF Transcript_5405/g.10444 Transcript_5405/m.10444 type:complete len:344 (-) Transcript_5405:193-1224(-)
MAKRVFNWLLVSFGSFWLLATHTKAFSAIPKPPTTLIDNNNKNNNIMSLATPQPPENQEQRTNNAILRVHGPDANGIVAAFSQLLYGHGCGIVDSEQHTDHTANLFFQRIHFDYTKMHTDRISLTSGIKEVCERFQMKSELNWGDKRKKVCVMISKYDHCLWELLLRHRAGELDCEIALIISNHPDLQNIADSFNIPFHVFKITKDNKQEVEAQELALLKEQEIDLVVLARYMQIITDDFCAAFPVINIHHSFLPAFIGGKPYHRAHERGVKLIGATAHYATADLDEGPIIEQDITRISHRDQVDDLIRKGRLLEKSVLVTAVKAHIEDRIIVYNNKCVIFDG